MSHDKESQDRLEAQEVASLARQQAIASFDPSLGTPIECWIERKVKSALSNLSRAKDREQAFWRKLRKHSGKGSKHDPEAIDRDLVHQAKDGSRLRDLQIDLAVCLSRMTPRQATICMFLISECDMSFAAQAAGIGIRQARRELEQIRLAFIPLMMQNEE